MASIVVNRGLQLIADRASGVSGAGNTIQVLSVDDRAVSFVAGDTTLGSPTNVFDVAFDSTPTRSSQTVTHIATIPAASGNFLIRRVALHNDTTTNVTGSSTTLIAGVDNQSFTKTSDSTLTITMKITYTSI